MTPTWAESFLWWGRLGWVVGVTLAAIGGVSAATAGVMEWAGRRKADKRPG